LKSTIKAAIVEDSGRPPKVEEIQLTSIEHGEVRVRIVACGVCHTDVAWADGDLFPVFPVVLGHEIAGVVEEIGAGVKRVRPGDRVALALSHHCGHCFYCETGRPMLCAERTRTRPRYFRNGDVVIQGYGVGGFSEQTIVPETSAILIPPDVPLAVAAVTGCATATGVGAVLNIAAVPAGAKVAILGAGGVGLNVIMGCKLVGAERIVVADPNPARRRLALEFGATDAIESNEESFRELEPEGFEFVFESAGRPEPMELAIRIGMRGSTTVLIGAPRPETEIRINALDIVNYQRRVVGCLTGGVRPDIDLDRYFRLYQRGLLQLDKLITAELPFSRITEAFERTHRGEGIRNVVRIGED
jgi:S-(hydroxymethyl)glutathione dehydrogenase / alcohol dehydrogenase